MKLKICGIRTHEMMRACLSGGIDYVGFNFVSDSKRRVLRVPITGSGNPFKLVGIFRDQSPSFILKMAEEYGLDVIQLHGKESADYIKDLHKQFPDPNLIQIWKALSVDENFEITDVQQYCKICELILFDGKNPGSGHKIANQDKLREAIDTTKRTGTKVGIAGGINADNIAKVREEFREVHLLDTASGIEVNGDFSITELQRVVQNFQV